jgi:hypothetical protein
LQGLLIVVRNSEFVRLTAAQMLGAFITAGLYQVESQYLLVQFGFEEQDFAFVLVITGLGMFISQVLTLFTLTDHVVRGF